MSRILLHEPSENHGECRSLLEGVASEVVACADHESLVSALGRGRPDVLVYVIHRLGQDLRLLQSLRRMAPLLPIILLGGPADLRARRAFQVLNPTYYGVLPVEGSELNDVVRGALRRISRH